jgi:serine phosphatase RsbU (regulator of sigma subunit)/CHASE3 domain sensor protein
VTFGIAHRRGAGASTVGSVSLRARLTGLFALLVVVVAIAAVAVNVAVSRVESNRQLVTGLLQPASVQSRSLLVSLVDQETGERGFVLTGDQAFLQPYRDGRRSFAGTLAHLRTEFGDDVALRTALDRVDQAAGTWRAVGATPEIDARRSGGPRHADLLVQAGKGKAAFDEVRSQVAALQRAIDTRTERAQLADRHHLSLLRLVVNLSRLLTVLILVMGAVLVRRWVLEPVNRLRARMRAVTDGDIEQEVLVDGPPEVAAIARDAENMRRRIVSELDATRGATEALSQHSPVVASLRGELAASATSTVGGLDVAGLVQSAEGVLAGDWWQAVPRPDGSTAVILADVSGHGAEAGLVAFAFKQRITALLDTGLDLESVFTLAARRSDLDNERFLSCLVVVVDPVRDRLSWVNAGHPPGLLVNRHGRDTPRELTPTGPLISAVTSGWTVSQAPFGPDDLLILCTDGVLEGRDAHGQEFGTEGLLQVVRGLRTWTAEEAVDECHAAVRRWAVDVRRDDATCVALTRVTQPATT